MADVFTEPPELPPRGQPDPPPGQEPRPAPPLRRLGQPGVPEGDLQRMGGDGWPTFLDLLGPVKDGVKEGLRAVTRFTGAITELDTSLERLHDPYMDRESLPIARELGRALVSGDSKSVQSILNNYKGKEELEGAVHQVSDEMEKLGIFVLFDAKEQSMKVIRPPSVWIKGPPGLALEFKAGGEAPQSFAVSNKTKRDLDGRDLPWDLKRIDGDADKAVASTSADIGGTIIGALSSRQENIEAARSSVELADVLKHLAGPDKDKPAPPPEKATELVKALLDKNMAPLVREVRTLRKEEDLEKLTEALNERLRPIGLFAKFEKGEALEIGCLAKLAADGYAILIPIDREVPPKGATGNNKDWHEPTTKPQPALLVHPKETRETTPQLALRELLERVASDQQTHWR